MSIEKQFALEGKNDNNSMFLISECFLSHHPSRKVIHLSSKHLSSTSMNISCEMTSVPKPKKSFNSTGITHPIEKKITLSKEKTLILNKELEEYETLLDSYSGTISTSNNDDIANISHFHLDESDIED